MRLRFGEFEFNSETGELWQGTTAIRVQPQPARVLALLIAFPNWIWSCRRVIEKLVSHSETSACDKDCRVTRENVSGVNFVRVQFKEVDPGLWVTSLFGHSMWCLLLHQLKGFASRAITTADLQLQAIGRCSVGHVETQAAVHIDEFIVPGRKLNRFPLLIVSLR
jgi:hypothetical protein